MKRLLFGLLLGLLVLFAISRRVDVGAVAGALASASLPLLLVSLVLVLVSIWLKGERWAMAVAAGTAASPRRRIFAATLVGTAGNIALPARVGDFARALVLRKHNDVTVSQALVSSWSVQVFDFLAVALLLWSFAPAADFAPRATLLGIVLVAVAVLLGLALARRRPRLLRPLSRVPGRFGVRLVSMAESALRGLAFLDTPPALLRVAVLTAAVWSLESLAMTTALRSFGLELPLAAGPLLAAALGLSFVLPLTPGSLGTFQLVSIFVLASFGVGREAAFAFSLGYQAATQLPLLVLGFAALQREGLDWRHIAERPEPDGAGS